MKKSHRFASSLVPASSRARNMARFALSENWLNTTPPYAATAM